MGAHWPLAEGIASQPTSVVNPCVPEGGAADIVAVWRGRWPGGALNAFVVEELLRPPVNELLGVEVGAEAVAGELDEGRQLLLILLDGPGVGGRVESCVPSAASSRSPSHFSRGPARASQPSAGTAGQLLGRLDRLRAAWRRRVGVSGSTPPSSWHDRGPNGTSRSRDQAGTYTRQITSLPMRSLETRRSGGRGRAKKGLPAPETSGWR